MIYCSQAAIVVMFPTDIWMIQIVLAFFNIEK